MVDTVLEVGGRALRDDRGAAVLAADHGGRGPVPGLRPPRGRRRLPPADPRLLTPTAPSRSCSTCASTPSPPPSAPTDRVGRAEVGGSGCGCGNRRARATSSRPVAGPAPSPWTARTFEWRGAHGNRDRSWGPRRWGGPKMWRWFSINVGDDTHFGGIRLGTGAGDLHRGWVWHEGRATSVAEWRVRTELAGDGVTHRVVHLDVVDKSGCTHPLRGEVMRVADIGQAGGTMVNEGLARWTYADLPAGAHRLRHLRVPAPARRPPGGRSSRSSSGPVPEPESEPSQGPVHAATTRSRSRSGAGWVARCATSGACPVAPPASPALSISTSRRRRR